MCLIQHTSDLEDLACLHVKITEDQLAIFNSTECKQAANSLRSELRDIASCVVVVGAGKKKRRGQKMKQTLWAYYTTHQGTVTFVCSSFVSQHWHWH